MADFDRIRDQTLLFFLDHLMEKGQSRTLHDLSCQFGARGFTKEMRQIAGGSQSGLKKFLSQFPSLFTIDGDKVTITPLTHDRNGASTRDYTKETVEFFSDKLVTYGNAEVPLKSLFGHRSQASSEIRHVSGQNVKEFKDFLCSQSNTFIVRDDYVVLKSVLDQLEKDGTNESLKRMPEEITFDPYLMQQLVNELEDTIFSLTDQYSNKISVEFLFNTIRSKEKMPPLWSNFVQQSSDLLTFLHMNSRVFLVQSNMVSLTADREQALRLGKVRTDPLTVRQANVESQTRLDSNKSSEKMTKPSNEPKVGPEKQQTSQLPKTVNSVNTLPSCTPLITVTTPTPASAVKSPKSLNERFRSHIIKAVTDNLQHDSRCSTSQLYSGECFYSADTRDNLQPTSDTFYDSIDLQLIKSKVVSTIKECEEVVADIFKNCTEVALDLEGINLGSSGEVTLIQVAFIHSKDFNGQPHSEAGTSTVPRVFIFDVLLCPNMIKSGLKSLLESDQIVKISHDIRNNSAALYKNFDIKLSNVFDTQVAHLIIQQQSTGKPAYKPTKYISLYTLCSLYGGPNLNPKAKDKLHKIYRKDFKYWQRRPLNDEMLVFAMTDVVSLLPNVYRTMRDQIRPEYEPLFRQLTYESIFTYINTDEIKQVKRQRKFDLELTDLKMKLFNNEKKKIVLSNREIRLLRYIDLTDEIRDKIEGPLNVAKKLKRFDSKKVNGNDVSPGNEMNETSEECIEKSKRLSINKSGLQGSEEGKVDLSDDELDDLDYEEILEEDEMAMDEEETENESVNSSLRSHEYMVMPPGEFISNSTDENSSSLSAAKASNQSCCCSCHQNGTLKVNKLNGDSTNGNVSKSQASFENGSHEVSTQTLSTGDIVITMIYVQEAEENNVSNS